MIKLAVLFLVTGVALVVAVTAAIGLAWLAVAIPVLVSTAAGYGLYALSRRSSGRRTTELANPPERPAEHREILVGRRGED
jgi:hypothetical protein